MFRVQLSVKAERDFEIAPGSVLDSGSIFKRLRLFKWKLNLIMINGKVEVDIDL